MLDAHGHLSDLNPAAAAVIGAGGRGGTHVSAFLRDTRTQIVCVVDADEAHADKRCKEIEGKQGFRPKLVQDMRDALADKSVDLRIFRDGDGRTNRSLIDVGGAVLVVSQFTLYGDTRKGRRPSFASAASPDQMPPGASRNFGIGRPHAASG